MRYQQSLIIEQRLDRVLRLIQTGNYSTPQLAREIGVSVPTISRCVEALRARGHEIRAERTQDGWSYALIPSHPANGAVHRPDTSHRDLTEVRT